MKSFFFLSCLVAFASQGLAQLSYPLVSIRAEITTDRVNSEIPTDRERQLFLWNIEKQVADVATENFRCMKWQAGGSPGTHPQAELWVRVIDNKSRLKPMIFLTYTAKYFSAGLSTQPEPLHELDRPIMDTHGYAGEIYVLRDEALRQIREQFVAPGFEQLFNRIFISNVPVTEQIEINDQHKRILIPVDADRLSLEPESTLILSLKQASVCKDFQKDCLLVLWSDGKWYEKRWFGALSSVPKDSTCWCPGCHQTQCHQPSWAELKNGIHHAAHRTVYLSKDHKHCSHCWGKNGLYRHPEAP